MCYIYIRLYLTIKKFLGEWHLWTRTFNWLIHINWLYCVSLLVSRLAMQFFRKTVSVIFLSYFFFLITTCYFMLTWKYLCTHTQRHRAQTLRHFVQLRTQKESAIRRTGGEKRRVKGLVNREWGGGSRQNQKTGDVVYETGPNLYWVNVKVRGVLHNSQESCTAAASVLRSFLISQTTDRERETCRSLRRWARRSVLTPPPSRVHRE